MNHVVPVMIMRLVHQNVMAYGLGMEVNVNLGKDMYSHLTTPINVMVVHGFWIVCHVPGTVVAIVLLAVGVVGVNIIQHVQYHHHVHPLIMGQQLHVQIIIKQLVHGIKLPMNIHAQLVIRGMEVNVIEVIHVIVVLLGVVGVHGRLHL